MTLVRLSASHLVVLLCGLLLALVVAAIEVGPWWWDMYALEYGLPRMEERWGFHLGTIRFQNDGQTHEWTGIVDLAADGRLARAGLRTHDVPFEYHGHGAFVFYYALRSADRGEAASLEVVNIDDWLAHKKAPRTVQIGSH